jgi:hypothetical protein
VTKTELIHGQDPVIDPRARPSQEKRRSVGDHTEYCRVVVSPNAHVGLQRPASLGLSSGMNAVSPTTVIIIDTKPKTRSDFQV